MAAPYAEHKAMLEALAAGTATPDQQRAAFAHLLTVKGQHNQELRDAERDSRDAYSEGRHDGGAEARGQDFGPGIY
jgi:uncharacterized membrane protein